MIVQIYEIQTPREAEKCIELGVDHLGSVILDRVENFVKETRKAEKTLTEVKEALLAKLDKLRDDLEDREKALPAHSVRPQQIMVIEELEEKIESLEKELLGFPRF